MYPLGRFMERHLTTPFKKALDSTYNQKVLGYNPLAYWPLDEKSGSNAANLGSLGSAADGTYSGPTLNATVGPDGGPAPRFDGINDHVNCYTATFDSAWDGDNFTIAVWAKIFNSAAWSDGVTRYVFRFLADANNYVGFNKAVGADLFRWICISGGNTAQRISDLGGTTDWVHFAAVRNGASITYYLNGADPNTQGGLGAWSGSLASNSVVIGAQNTTQAFWNGYVSRLAVWDTQLTAAAILDLATV